MSTKWRKTCVNQHVLMFLYKKTTSKHIIVSPFGAHFYPPLDDYIIMVKVSILYSCRPILVTFMYAVYHDTTVYLAVFLH